MIRMVYRKSFIRKGKDSVDSLDSVDKFWIETLTDIEKRERTTFDHGWDSPNLETNTGRTTPIKAGTNTSLVAAIPSTVPVAAAFDKEIKFVSSDSMDILKGETW